MTAPKYDIVQMDYQNPDAESDLKLNVIVVPNTPEERLLENIKFNSSYCDNWLFVKQQNDKSAILVGGGASINDHVEDIKKLKEDGGTVIAMNGSAKWCRDNGITPDWQVIVDAQEDTSFLVDEDCDSYFASQCDPKTIKKAKNLTLVHYGSESIEQFLPEKRMRKGGYTLLGCGSTVGFAAMSVAYSQGYRDLHIFGYDSSYKDGKSHAYYQALNRFMPTTEMEWRGKTYQLSVAMKAQAEKFPINALALKHAGCEIHVYGEGLLQAIYNTKYEDMSEREKYQLMWHVPAYRNVAPGESLVDVFLVLAKPDSRIIDFGCGTGRAGLRLSEAGKDVVLVDFADNCRDEEALHLPFYQADLTEGIPVSAKYGFCTDVMEHIPEKDVDKVLKNIFESAKNVFFQISTVEDQFGKMFDVVLHHTVKPHDWWLAKLRQYGKVEYDQNKGICSLFYVMGE